MTAQGSGTTKTSALAQPHVRLTLEMMLLLVGAELTRTVALPWRIAGVVFSVLAVVQGVRAVNALRARRREHPDIQAFGPAGSALLGLGIAIGVGLTVLQLVLLAAWPLVVEQEACRDRALTQSALETCEQDLADRLAELSPIRPPSD